VNYDKEGRDPPSSRRAEAGGEPSTIERPRVRARLVDQGELSRGGAATRPNAAALARGVGHGIAAHGVNVALQIRVGA